MGSTARIVSGSILVVLALVGLAFIHDQEVQRARGAASLLEHTRDVVAEIDRTRLLLRDSEVGQRGYLLTGRAASLEPYEAARAGIPEALRRLRALVSDNPEQLERVALLTREAEARLARIAETVRLQASGDAAGALASIETGLGRRQMESIRNVGNAIRAEEERLLAERSKIAETSLDRIRKTSLAGVAIALALLGSLLAVIYRDLVGRTEAQAELRRSEEGLRTTLGSIGDAVLATDSGGRVALLNPVAETLTGWTSDEARGRPVTEVFRILDELTRAELPSPVDRVIREGRVVGLAHHTILVSRTGAETPIADSGAPIRDAGGALSGVVLVFRDISAQRLADARGERLAAIVASSRHAIVGEKLDGTITDWNPGAEALFGYAAEEMIGRRMRDLAAPGQDDPSVSPAAGSPAAEVELRRRTRDGRILEVAESVSPIRDPEGRGVVGFSRLVRDVTERRRQRDEVQAARRRAEEASAAKDRFIATLSHELRTPLTPILASVHRLAQRDDLGPGMAESLAMIRRNVELEARLIDDLLDLTRIARGKLELRIAPLDLNALLQAVAQSARSELGGKGLQMREKLVARDHFVRGDAARLHQVFGNLLRNAIKFTSRGGSVTLTTDNPVPGRIRVQVADTGRGIEPGLLATMFDAFVQGETTHQGRGLGLGLSIARNLVEEHGGTISASSEGPGKGSAFDVAFATTAERPREAQPPAGRSPGDTGARVLLVEDDADTAEAMRLLITEAGFRVRTADSLGGAVDAFRREPADVVVTDVGLPDGSGLDLLDRLRALAPDVKAIALTGYGMDGDISKSRSRGFSEHFVKPVDFDRLIAAIDRLARA